MSFTLDLSKFAAKAGANMDAVVRRTVLDIGERLVEKSPVGDATYWKNPPPKGYVGGRFRGNWQYGFDAIPAGDLPDIDRFGAMTNARLSASIAGAPGAGVHYLVNNLPYARRIEDGWSTQAPSGVLGTTVLEFEGIVSRAATEVNR